MWNIYLGFLMARFIHDNIIILAFRATVCIAQGPLLHSECVLPGAITLIVSVYCPGPLPYSECVLPGPLPYSECVLPGAITL